MKNMLHLDSLGGKAGCSRDFPLGHRRDPSCFGTKAWEQLMRIIHSTYDNTD